MSIISYVYDDEPFNDFNRLFNQAFDARVRSPNGQLQRQEGLMRPKMDIHESKERNELTATFELPGMKKDNVSIDIQNNRLTVSGRSALSNDLGREGYSVQERRYGSFSRTIPVPPGTKPENVKANMEHGILTVKFPSITEQAPKRISIT